ncbi:MAG: hypothetical protein R3D67_17470 [Hyphomicrobiaceae bacterium]
MMRKPSRPGTHLEIDPEERFKTPQSVLADKKMTNAEKVAMLQSWKVLVEQRLNAADEGMTEHPKGELTRDAELLQAITCCLETAPA